MSNTHLHIVSKGFEVNGFHVPPFALHAGEIVVINVIGGAGRQSRRKWLADIFTGTVKNASVTLTQQLHFAEHFHESKFRSWLWPATVGEYLRMNANSADPISKKIFEIQEIDPNTKVKALFAGQRKLLEISAKLTVVDNIVFDLEGAGPEQAQHAYAWVKEKVKAGGSAIFLDWTDEMSADCTAYIALELTARAEFT